MPEQRRSQTTSPPVEDTPTIVDPAQWVYVQTGATAGFYERQLPSGRMQTLPMEKPPQTDYQIRTVQRFGTPMGHSQMFAEMRKEPGTVTPWSTEGLEYAERASRQQFWSELGLPQYSMYQPFSVPEGAVIQSVTPKGEDLEITFATSEPAAAMKPSVKEQYFISRLKAFDELVAKGISVTGKTKAKTTTAKKVLAFPHRIRDYEELAEAEAKAVEKYTPSQEKTVFFVSRMKLADDMEQAQSTLNKMVAQVTKPAVTYKPPFHIGKLKQYDDLLTAQPPTMPQLDKTMELIGKKLAVGTDLEQAEYIYLSKNYPDVAKQLATVQGINRKLASGEDLSIQEAITVASVAPDIAKQLASTQKVENAVTALTGKGSRTLRTFQQQSRKFYEELGYPEFGGEYAPFSVPEGYEIKGLSETVKGLNIQLQPIGYTEPPKSIAQQVQEYSFPFATKGGIIPAALGLTAVTEKYPHLQQPSQLEMGKEIVAGAIGTAENLVYSVGRLAGVQGLPEPPATVVSGILSSIRQQPIGAIKLPVTSLPYGGKTLAFVTSQELEYVAEHPAYAFGSILGEVVVSYGVGKGLEVGGKALKKGVTVGAKKVSAFMDTSVEPRLVAIAERGQPYIQSYIVEPAKEALGALKPAWFDDLAAAKRYVNVVGQVYGARGLPPSVTEALSLAKEEVVSWIPIHFDLKAAVQGAKGYSSYIRAVVVPSVKDTLAAAKPTLVKYATPPIFHEYPLSVWQAVGTHIAVSHITPFAGLVESTLARYAMPPLSTPMKEALSLTKSVILPNLAYQSNIALTAAKKYAAPPDVFKSVSEWQAGFREIVLADMQRQAAAKIPSFTLPKTYAEATTTAGTLYLMMAKPIVAPTKVAGKLAMGSIRYWLGLPVKETIVRTPLIFEASQVKAAPQLKRLVSKPVQESGIVGARQVQVTQTIQSQAVKDQQIPNIVAWAGQAYPGTRQRAGQVAEELVMLQYPYEALQVQVPQRIEVRETQLLTPLVSILQVQSSKRLLDMQASTLKTQVAISRSNLEKMAERSIMQVQTPSFEAKTRFTPFTFTIPKITGRTRDLTTQDITTQLVSQVNQQISQITAAQTSVSLKTPTLQEQKRQMEQYTRNIKKKYPYGRYKRQYPIWTAKQLQKVLIGD